MSRTTTIAREVRADEVNFIAEARAIQRKALHGQTSIVRLGQIIFFSTESGDAWMLDPDDGEAACLARDFEEREIPIEETGSRLAVAWSARYAIDGEFFIVVESEGSSRAIAGYPIPEIQRLITGQPFETAPPELDAADIAERLKTGRNDPCPCGSGTKYKKCCLAKDQALVREATKAREQETERRAESRVAERQSKKRDQITGAEAEEEVDVFNEEHEAGPATAVVQKLSALWRQFEALEHPSSEQMDLFLEGLLALAPEETEWNGLFHQFATKNHADLPRVFRRIASSIPHTKETGFSFFLWAAAETFDRRGDRHLLREVAAEFQTLDRESYDADALDHLEDYLLAAGDATGTLQLCEHFLPIVREDPGLMPYATPMLCGRIFELRIGASLRSEADAHRPAADVAALLRAGLEEEIHPEAAANAAAVITAEAPPCEWTREHFDLPGGGIAGDDAWPAVLRLSATLISVAREAWQIEQIPPGCATVGLQMLLNAVYESLEKGAKRKKTGGNLLSYLTPAGIDKRIATTCRDVIGINAPKARLLLDAHDTLARFASRHRLISPAEAGQTQKELARLRSFLD